MCSGNQVNQLWEKNWLYIIQSINGKLRPFFVTNVVFQRVSLSWIVESKNKSCLILKRTFLIELLMAHGITLRFIHNCMFARLKSCYNLNKM